jgi:hypothetical protein
MSTASSAAVAMPGDTAPAHRRPAANANADAERAAAYADFLEEIGAATRDERFRRAAAFLRGKPAGRRSLPDDAFVSETIWLVETKAAASVAEAARMVSPTVPGNHSVESTARRLARKAVTELNKRFEVAGDTP